MEQVLDQRQKTWEVKVGEQRREDRGKKDLHHEDKNRHARNDHHSCVQSIAGKNKRSQCPNDRRKEQGSASDSLQSRWSAYTKGNVKHLHRSGRLVGMS